MLSNLPAPGAFSPEMLLLLQMLAASAAPNLSEGSDGTAFDDFGKSQPPPGQGQGPNTFVPPNGMNANPLDPFRFSAGIEALINADPVPPSQTANVPLGPGGVVLPWVEQQRMAQMSTARRQQNTGRRQGRG